MPPVPDWKRALDTGAQFTELRRSQARKLASDLVEQGQLAKNQVSAYVDELVDASRRRSEQLRAIVRTEVERQLRVIGVATKSDLDALERKLRATNGAKARGAGTKPGVKRSATKRTPAKKTATKAAKPAKPAKTAAKRARSA
jgi:polyhydroxyalkanoate synthesis regulator phasin